MAAESQRGAVLPQHAGLQLRSNCCCRRDRCCLSPPLLLVASRCRLRRSFLLTPRFPPVAPSSPCLHPNLNTLQTQQPILAPPGLCAVADARATYLRGHAGGYHHHHHGGGGGFGYVAHRQAAATRHAARALGADARFAVAGQRRGLLAEKAEKAADAAKEVYRKDDGTLMFRDPNAKPPPPRANLEAGRGGSGQLVDHGGVYTYGGFYVPNYVGGAYTSAGLFIPGMHPLAGGGAYYPYGAGWGGGYGYRGFGGRFDPYFW